AENLEFTGAAVPDQNGAGIRFQARDLVVRDCYFHGNQRSILTSPQRNILIEHSEFFDNGTNDGLSPNVGVDRAEQLIFRHNWSHASRKGDLLRTYARRNYLIANRFTEEIDVSGDLVQFSVGGEAYMFGNLLEQVVSGNNNMIRFAPQGNEHGDLSRLVFVHNTVVNLNPTDNFLLINAGVSTKPTLSNNLFFGIKPLAGDWIQSGNVLLPIEDSDNVLIDPLTYNYRLQGAAVQAIDKGEDVTGLYPPLQDFKPTQYVHPCRSEPRVQQGAQADVGAYEHSSLVEN
ncbi:MAG: hypothetical protein MUF64_17400, partial [Polyangiaceae bacterium]|nr:hypothetical protein [Polyangiaceae bacterium]